MTTFDTRGRLIAERKYITEGTCDWIIQSPIFLDWAEGRCNQLQIRGGPGVGKTVASAFIVKTLNDTLRSNDILAVYACSFIHGQTTSAANILCALAGQIDENSPESMTKCKRFLERHVDLDFEILEFQDLILEMSFSGDIQRIFIIIDGLDGFEWEQFDHLMAIVEIPQRKRKVKMLVTCRQIPVVEKAMREYSTLSIDKDHSRADIVQYIHVSDTLRRSNLASMPPRDLAEISKRLIERPSTYVSSLICTESPMKSMHGMIRD